MKAPKRTRGGERFFEIYSAESNDHPERTDWGVRGKTGGILYEAEFCNFTKEIAKRICDSENAGEALDWEDMKEKLEKEGFNLSL